MRLVLLGCRKTVLNVSWGSRDVVTCMMTAKVVRRRENNTE